MAASLADIKTQAEALLGARVLDSATAFGELTVRVAPVDIVDVLRALRDDPGLRFETLVDICGVDYPTRAERFDVVYHLLSMHKNIRFRVKVAIGDGEAVPSATAVWPVADWFEREAFDMYGILFANHPDLRRILTDYGFQGYPLRKDFPTTGYVEVRYDDTEKRVVYEPVKLNQDFRNFDFVSPWEGMLNALPGDEKATKG